MAKGRAKISSSEGLATPQPRSLRSRKRECPSDEVSLTDDVQASVHQQDTEDNNKEVAATLLQHSHSPLQESTLTSAQQDQAAEQQPDDTTEEKHVKGTSFYLEDEVVKAFEGQEEMTVANPENDSQLESFRVYTESEVKGKNPLVLLKRSGSGKHCTRCSKQAFLSTDILIHTENDNEEEITAEECNKSAFQTCTDQLHVCLSTSEEGGESCVTALEEQLDARENSHCDLERNQETSHDETSHDETSQDVCTADVKEVTKEAVAGLPAKKKRRMGMCGLTEKERSHILQTQKRENGQNGLERVERQMCNNKADLSAKEEIISSLSLPSSPPPIPAASVTEPREAEIKLKSLRCEGVDRAETEVHIAVCDPGCSEGKSYVADGGLVPGPEQTGDSKSDPPAEEEEANLGNPEQQEPESSTAEIIAEIHLKQMEGGENWSAEVETCYTNPNEETEKQKDGSEAAPLQVHSVTITTDEKKEEMTGDAGDADRAETGASSSDTEREGFNCGSVELCEAAVTPGGSERKDSCGPDVKPATTPTMNEDPESRDTTDPFGSGCLDYVSDSQLNTIVWIEEEMMDKDGALGSSDCNEDATDLICGLIRELSCLNRTVMATHRELENLRRGSKSSRSSAR